MKIILQEWYQIIHFQPESLHLELFSSSSKNNLSTSFKWHMTCNMLCFILDLFAKYLFICISMHCSHILYRIQSNIIICQWSLSYLYWATKHVLTGCEEMVRLGDIAFIKYGCSSLVRVANYSRIPWRIFVFHCQYLKLESFSSLSSESNLKPSYVSGSQREGRGPRRGNKIWATELQRRYDLTI